MTFTNPTVLNVTTQTVTVSVPEQDYFYWPCMSGEKYAPTLVLGSGSAGASGYKALGQYPCVFISRPSTTAPSGSALWPVLPSWKYSGAGFNGYTLSFRLNVGNSSSSGPQGVGIQFSGTQGSNNDSMTFNVGQSVSWNFHNTGAGLPLTVAAQTWYNVQMDIDAAGKLTLTINGTVYLTGQQTNVYTQPLQLYAVATYFTGWSGSEAYFSQVQVTYK